MSDLDIEVVTITRREYNDFLAAVEQLLALKAHGVDNWYGDAMSSIGE